VQDQLTSYFWSGDTLRSRSVGSTIPTATLEVPALSARLAADCEREITRLGLELGDVEPLSLARARTRWPDYRHYVQAVADWTRAQGLPDLLGACRTWGVESENRPQRGQFLPDLKAHSPAMGQKDGEKWTAAADLQPTLPKSDRLLDSSDVALMACRGARYHHDGGQYGAAAFCNLFLSEDKGLDLHFPATGLRMPLCRGTVVVFDTGQPHAVIPRHSSSFDPAGFTTGQSDTQLFLTWELPIEDAYVARALQVRFDTDPATASQLSEGQLWRNGAPAMLCPESGQWVTTAQGA
jgi:hypothetical protein